MERTVRRKRGVIGIRKLTVDDLAAFRDLHRMGLSESPDAFVESLGENAAQTDEEVFATLSRGEGWGAFQGDRLVAKFTIDTLPYAMVAHTRWIHGLYAAPEARGAARVAERLLQAALEDARGQGVTRVLLWMNDTNARAGAFYKRLGFTEIGRVPSGLNLDGRLVDDVLMCLAV